MIRTSVTLLVILFLISLVFLLQDDVQAAKLTLSALLGTYILIGLSLYFSRSKK